VARIAESEKLRFRIIRIARVARKVENEVVRVAETTTARVAER